MLDRLVAEILRCELLLLQFRVRSHAVLSVAAREVKHRHIECVEARESHDLVFVAELSQLLLKACNGRIVQFLFPVKRRRAVVCEQFARKFCVNRVREFLSLR